MAIDDESDTEIVRVRFEVPDRIDLEAFFLKELVHAGWRLELVADDPVDLTFEVEGHGFFGQVEIPVAHEPVQRFAVQLV